MIMFFIQSLGLANELKAWTYFFYIAGDYYHTGPNYTDKDIVRLENQDWIIYKKIKSMAKKDKLNNYVILYDPRGLGLPFSNKHVRLYVYKKSKQVHSNGWWVPEVNITKPSLMRKIVKKAEKHLKGALSETYKLFYFYGEYIPSYKGVLYDLSNKDDMYSLNEWKEGMKYFYKHGGLDLIIMHACYMNNDEFLRSVMELSKHIIVDIDGIPNAPMKLKDALFMTESFPEYIIDTVLDRNRNTEYPFDLISYKLEDFKVYTSLLNSLKEELDLETYNESINKLKNSDRDIWEESFSNNIIFAEETDEVFVPQIGFLSHLSRFLLEEEAFENLVEFIGSKPEFKNLKVSFQLD